MADTDDQYLDLTNPYWQDGCAWGLAMGAVTGGCERTGGGEKPGDTAIGEGGLCVVTVFDEEGWTDLCVRYPAGTIDIHTAFDGLCSAINNGEGLSASVSYTTNSNNQITALLTATIGTHLVAKYKATSYADGTINDGTGFGYEIITDGVTTYSGTSGYVTTRNIGGVYYYDLRYKCTTIGGVHICALNAYKSMQMYYYEGNSPYYYVNGKIRDSTGPLSDRLTTDGKTYGYINTQCMCFTNPNTLSAAEQQYTNIKPIKLDGKATDFLVSYYRCTYESSKVHFAKLCGTNVGMAYLPFGSVGDTSCVYIPLDTGAVYAQYVDTQIAKQQAKQTTQTAVIATEEG